MNINLLTNEQVESLKTETEYDKKRGLIYFKDVIDYDVKAVIDTPNNWNNPNKFDFLFGARIHIYNYGGDITLFEGIRDDIFYESGTISAIISLDNTAIIEINKNEHSTKYGDWALVNVLIKGDKADNIFMTPLAMKAYKEHKYNSLIFIRFITNDSFMNVICKGDPTTTIVAEHFTSFVFPQSEMFAYDKKNPGRFWKKYK